MSTCEKPTRYLSVGRIRVEAPATGAKVERIFFTPTKEFSVSYVKKNYAAFLLTEKEPRCGRLIPYELQEGVPICVLSNGIGKDFSSLVSIALQQSAVKLEVEVKDKKSECKGNDEASECKGNDETSGSKGNDETSGSKGNDETSECRDEDGMTSKLLLHTITIPFGDQTK